MSEQRGQWENYLRDMSTGLVAEHKRALVLMNEIIATLPPSPPLSRRQRQLRRARYWFNRNVAWRFARHVPDEDCW